MISNDKGREKLSYGARELQEAKRHAQSLSLQSAVLKTANGAQGSDPYNTSGSFDRKKHWARVGRR